MNVKAIVMAIMISCLLVFDECEANIGTFGSNDLGDDHSDVLTNVRDDTTHATCHEERG